MPSKKQRAKKPGSKAAQEKVAEESRRGFVWAKHEDDAAQWLSTQLRQQQEQDSRGRVYAYAPESDRETQRPDRPTNSRHTGGSKQYAIKGKVTEVVDEMHDAANGVIKMQMPTKCSMAGDVINERRTPEQLGPDVQPTNNSGSGAVSTLEGCAESTLEGSRNPRTIAMKGLLQEHGLATMPPEWDSKMGRLLLQEVLQIRVNKLNKAKKQRDKRRENRKQEKVMACGHPL